MQRETEEPQILRVRLPIEKEVLGIVQQRLGGSRMRVLCLDGKERICRIPGRLRRALWVRENDVVIVEPWELG
ncbi:translation initiation factor IF-1A, partial [Candidatus Woesearchaeota archaeon]|nr:translation initiation factor IF-1A [Candidatus Woesearchaeota archaeon]